MCTRSVAVTTLYIFLSGLLTQINTTPKETWQRRTLNKESFPYTQWNHRNSDCLVNQWKCNSGECIKLEDVCDGIANCGDKSDETFVNCRNIKCPSYLFRCTYGACVDGDSKCNGVQNCIDNSDEQHKDCVKNATATNDCARNQFRCSSTKQCISLDGLCDGVVDCQDESDENVFECSNVPCAPYLYRCAYGACVDSDAECDGKIQCVDGSDEIAEVCNKKFPPAAKPAVPTHHQGYCQVPKIDGCNITIEGSRIVTDYVKSATLIYLECDKHNSCNVCSHDGSWGKQKFCPSICREIPNASEHLVCNYNSKTIACDTPLLSGSKMNVKCHDVYEMTVSCMNSQWQEHVPYCGPKLEKQSLKITLEFTDELEIVISGMGDVESILNYDLKLRLNKLLLNDLANGIKSTHTSGLNVTLHDVRNNVKKVATIKKEAVERYPTKVYGLRSSPNTDLLVPLEIHDVRKDSSNDVITKLLPKESSTFIDSKGNKCLPVNANLERDLVIWD